MTSHIRGGRRRTIIVSLMMVLVAGGTVIANVATAQQTGLPFEIQTLDGRGNNRANPTWGLAGTNYSRVRPARYADGIGELVAPVNSRRVSNRVHNDISQNLFSERRVTQWGFAWGQVLDHTFGLREAPGVGNSPDPSSRNIDFDPNDPLEEFANDLDGIPFTRSAIAPNTGVTTPREQVNTVSSYIDAWFLYGGTAERLEWMREGPVDGNLANNGAKFLLVNGMLPRRETRGNPATAPAMDIDGHLRAQPNRAVVAGDVRANENIGLTANHTLFAREHNRIVDRLPSSLTNEQKFQIARRVVIATQQYITYNEWLPALGVSIPAYRGYNPNVNANLTNEFATNGYRAHSMIHGEFEIVAERSRYSQATLDRIEARGIEIIAEGDEVEFVIPLNIAFFNPDLLQDLQLGPMLQGLGLEPQYNNDEQIDNQLRSVLFQIPVPGNPGCLDGPTLPACFRGVSDLGAIDIERGRDHGLPSYNQLRQAYGLAPRSTFTGITGESTDRFPTGLSTNDPRTLEFVRLRDIDGRPIDLNDEEAVDGDAVDGDRRATVAAQLRALYGTVDRVDGFAGMVAEPHLPFTEFGELQHAIWAREFTRLRDGDRFFYGNDPGLSWIRSNFGIDFRRTLRDVIVSNTDIPAADLNENVFLVDDAQLPPVACNLTYTITNQWDGGFQVALTIRNTGSTPINGWQLRWRLANGQRLTQLWNSRGAQSGPNVVVANESWNAVIPPGGSVQGVGFNATWDNVANAVPPQFTLNNRRCASQ